MLINSKTTIIGRKIHLCPYRKEHVETYNQWMKDPQLQELTGSEPLTLQQEYEMQESWKISDDKLTFIIIDALSHKMLGDTNIYFSKDNPEDDFWAIGEVEIMIAEKSCRGKGCGWQAMHLMILYAVNKFPKLKLFQAKIKTYNSPSIKMFQKMGFKEVSRSQVFDEITYEVEITSSWIESLKVQADTFTVQEEE